MTRYADPERCPDCLGAMPYGTTRCPSCGLSLAGPVAARLFEALSTADALLVELRSPAPATEPATPTAVPSGAAPAAPAPRRHTGLSTASVPKILLGLGALCLLVAALVFLAVTWAAMGVGGRTATLVGFTAVAGALAAWTARHDLRAATESLGVVTLGLLAFDLFGARDAGWFGGIGTPGFLVLLGVVVLVVGGATALAVRRTPTGALVAAEVIAAIALGTGVSGVVSADWFAASAALTLAVVATWVTTYVAHTLRLRVLTAGAGVVGALSWVALTMSSADRALTHPSLRELWVGLEVWPLLVAAVLVGALAVPGGVPRPARLTALSLATLVLSVVLLAPFGDEPVTVATAAGAVLLVLFSAAAWFTPAAWRPGLGAPLVLGATWMLTAGLLLALESVRRLLEAGSALWSGSTGTVLPPAPHDDQTLAAWLLPLLVVAAGAGAVSLARSFALADRVLSPATDLDLLAAVAAATAVLTAAAYAVPLWLVLALVLVAAVSFTARAVLRDASLPLTLAALFLTGAVLVSLHDERLTLTAAATALVSTLLVHLRWRTFEVAVAAGALAAVSVAGVVWTLGAVADVAPQWSTVAVLGALAVLVLGMPWVDGGLRRNAPANQARLGLEGAALASAAVVSLAGIDLAVSVNEATWAAVYLTLTGATVSALALLRSDRRPAGWLGGLLLASATWVRLADIGVDTPEAYTLPSAMALLTVGLVHLWRNPGASTMTALTPGLLLALTPSLLWVLVDPGTLRSVLLGAACLGLVLVGIRVHWTAPVVHAAAVGTLLVLRHATPLAEAVPRWALIGTAGALLVAVGITWEQRLREARTLAGYVRALR